VEVTRLGLVLPDDLSHADWLRIGGKVTETVASAMWIMGDWLVFGHKHYGDSLWHGRTPIELYDRLADETGYASGTLQNARMVCARIPRSRRRENVTYSHAQEIVARCDSQEDIEGWVDYVSNERPSTKALREKLRRDTATERSEADDVGVTSFLEVARQFARDFNANRTEVSPIMRAELRKILKPVLEELR